MFLSRGEKWFSAMNYILLTVFAFLTLAPFLQVAAQSFSSHRAVVSGEVTFWPIGWNVLSYKEVLGDRAFWSGFQISVLRTVAGSALSVLLTALMAYPLAKSYFWGRSAILFMIVFSMLFSGGLIPTFLLVKSLGLLNTFWVYILPGAIGAFNVIIMRNFFQSIPEELEESARMDGCRNFGILFRIIIPLSMPVIATIALFCAVGHWNSFFDAVIYVQNRELFPLQVYLREVVQLDLAQNKLKDELERQVIANESLKAATLIASTVPILVVYPFLQTYFVKGIMLGSVKG